jgi:hypothetical protein
MVNRQQMNSDLGKNSHPTAFLGVKISHQQYE